LNQPPREVIGRVEVREHEISERANLVSAGRARGTRRCLIRLAGLVKKVGGGDVLNHEILLTGARGAGSGPQRGGRPSVGLQRRRGQAGSVRSTPNLRWVCVGLNGLAVPLLWDACPLVTC